MGFRPVIRNGVPAIRPVIRIEPQLVGTLAGRSSPDKGDAKRRKAVGRTDRSRYFVAENPKRAERHFERRGSEKQSLQQCACISPQQRQWIVIPSGDSRWLTKHDEYRATCRWHNVSDFIREQPQLVWRDNLQRIQLVFSGVIEEGSGGPASMHNHEFDRM